VAPAPSPVAASPDSVRDAEQEVVAARAKREEERRQGERQRAVASVKIVMYSTSWCGYCRAARQWLGSQGIAYVDKDVERDRSAAAHMRAINPRGGVPTFEIDQQVLTGFSAAHLAGAIARAAEQRSR